MAWIPCTQDARPTLRGLIVQPKEVDGESPDDSPYPWTQLERVPCRNGPACWYVCDEHGNRVKRDGHLIRLIVSNERAKRVARKAHRRAFKHALQRGETVLDQTYRDKRILWWSVFLVIAGGFAALAVWILLVMLSLWQDDLPMISPDYHDQACLLVALLVLGALLVFVPPLVFFYLLATRPNVSAARFKGRGLVATLRNDREISVDWIHLQDMRSIGALVRLRFRTGPTVWFLANDRRTGVVLDVIEEMLLPSSAAARERRYRNALIRAGLYCIVGGCIIFAAMYPINPTEAADKLVDLAVLFFLILVMGVLRVMPLSLRKAWRNYKRRRATVQSTARE